MAEHVGKVVTMYFDDIANPRFSSPPDRGGITTDGKSSVSYYDLPHGVRLAKIKTGGIETRYMRFGGLAASIGQAELSRLGVLSNEQYPDLVIAHEPASGGYFTIVPNELRHHVKRLRRIQRPMGNDRPPLLGKSEPWVRIEASMYSEGIYEKSAEGPGMVDIVNELPATAQACLSVAQFLVAQELALTGSWQDSGDIEELG